MKKLLIIAMLLQYPYLLFAQKKDTVLNILNARINQLVTSMRVNNHLSAYLTNIHHNNFELTAVNDSPAVAWHTQLKGSVLTAGVFKNRIIVITYTVRHLKYGKAHDFSGLIFDAATGRQLGEKLFYQSDTGKYERAFSFDFTENSFRLVVKDEGTERRKYHNFDKPTFFSKVSPFYSLPIFGITHQVQVFNYNQQLETTSVGDFAVKGGLIGYDFDKKGDLMVALLNDNDIEIDKFITGNGAPISSIKAGLNLKSELGRRKMPSIIVKASADNPDEFFYAIEGNTSHSAEARLGKVNFADNTSTSVITTFTDDELKAMEKNYTPVNKDITKIDFRNAKDMDIADLLVTGDKVILPMQASTVSSYTIDDSQYYTSGVGAAIYNVFSTDLKPLYKAILPTRATADANVSFNENNHIGMNGNKLYILGNADDPKRNGGLYAVLDLKSGRWDKMELIGKMEEQVSLFDAIWLKNVFFMPNFSTPPRLSTGQLNLRMKRY